MSERRPTHPPMPPSFGRVASPKAPQTNRPPLTAYLPLTQDSSPLTTRNQNLAQLIHNRSFASLQDSRRASLRTQSYRMDRTEESEEEPDVELGRSKTRLSIRTDRADSFVPPPPPGFPLSSKRGSIATINDRDQRRLSIVPPSLTTEQMRSQRLIGNSNPRYKWGQYWKTEEELKSMKKSLRKYYSRNNYLIQQYLYIDRLLDSSLPMDLIEEYNTPVVNIPPTIRENSDGSTGNGCPPGQSVSKVKRTKDIYKMPRDESTPLLSSRSPSSEDIENGCPSSPTHDIPMFSIDEEDDGSGKIVTVAIYVNLAANTLLLIFKIIVTIMTDSLSVLASLVDAALDLLSTGIVWTTNYLVSRADDDLERYPVGNRRLEPIGVLVFSVVMITSFIQVALQSFNKLTGSDRTVVELSPSAIAIMAATVGIKGLCWLWCRLIKNSSVQALAQDAVTDVIFNTFSIIFPLVGFYLQIWWLDPLGGLALSLYVIVSWCVTSRTHILNLTGCAASADERNILLYLTMRFAHTIKSIQQCTAYHAGDKINVEVDIVLDENMSLRDSHDLGESLQYVLESVPGVERAWVHSDYRSENLPSHMKQ